MRSFLRASSNNSATVPVEPLAPVVYSRLIARQDWEAVRGVLSTKEGQRSAQSEIGSSADIDGALHFACRFHPPVDVIQTMANVFPGSISQADNMGRFPLHIACKWGASPRVIKFLIDENREAAGLQDAMGKTPLHLTCESYAQKYSSRRAEGRPLKESMVEVVRSLCKAAPDSVNLEDLDDMTALEYAIEGDVELKVVRSIQKACEKDWKHRRAPGTTHEIVERSLLEQSQQRSQKLTRDLLEMSNATMNMSLSSLGDDGKGVGTRPPVPVPNQPRKKASTRALMA